jgi:hypothetical protein
VLWRGKPPVDTADVRGAAADLAICPVALLDLKDREGIVTILGSVQSAVAPYGHPGSDIGPVADSSGSEAGNSSLLGTDEKRHSDRNAAATVHTAV